MNIKRYTAPDMKTAMARIREDMGHDAVILSSRQENGRLEIIAAREFDERLFTQSKETVSTAKRYNKKSPDYLDPVNDLPAVKPRPQKPRPMAKKIDVPASEVPVGLRSQPADPVNRKESKELESIRGELRAMHELLQDQISQWAWDDLSRKEPMRMQMIRRLCLLGIDREFARKVVEPVKLSTASEHSWHEVLVSLSHRLKTQEKDLLKQGGVLALIGNSGAGKTTSLVKLAARFAMRHGRENVMILSTDDYRVGARAQLQAYAEIMQIPMQMVTSAEQLRRSIQAYSQTRRLILIDTPGLSFNDERRKELLKLLRSVPEVRCQLVMPASAHAGNQKHTLKQFAAFKPEAVILSKLDETTTLGGSLSLLAGNNMPVSYISAGAKVPEDIEAARATRLVVRAVELCKRYPQVSKQMAQDSAPMLAGVVNE